MKKALTVVLFSCLVAPGCGPRAEERPAQEEEIVVAAAANLSEAFEEAGRRFTEKTGVRVTNSFGATADLAKQIENGAPFDVFAAADTKHVEALDAKGLLTESSRAVYARGRLVLWFPRGAGSVQDLTSDKVSKVAVAKPELAPYGAAAVEALRALGVWERVEPKVVYAQNVAQAKQFAATGNAEAAFVPRSLVKPDEGAAVLLDSALHRPIDQALGIVRASQKQAAARRFAEFVLGDEGQALLERHGYEKR